MILLIRSVKKLRTILTLGHDEVEGEDDDQEDEGDEEEEDSHFLEIQENLLQK